MKILSNRDNDKNTLSIESKETINNLLGQIDYEEPFYSQNKKDIQNFLIEKDSTKVTPIQDTLLSIRKCSKDETQKGGKSPDNERSTYYINGQDDIENLSLLIPSENRLDHWNPNTLKNDYKLYNNSKKFIVDDHHHPRSKFIKRILSQNKSFTSIRKIDNKEKSYYNLWQEQEIMDVPTFSSTSNNSRDKGYQDIKSLIMKRKYIGIHSDRHNNKKF